jgi:hypothetical protein
MPEKSLGTVFVGSGFVAKYPEGGGNFSVVLQYLLGLRRMGVRGIWYEVLRSSGIAEEDARLAATFRRRLAACGLAEAFHLVVCENEGEPSGRSFGLGRRQVRELLHGPNILLNLSYSVKPPMLLDFDRRILCSLDPTEVCFWMQQMEMGQSHHQEFASIGLNTCGKDSRVPRTDVRWRTYFPLVDTEMLQAVPAPAHPRFSTVGQWYWDGMIQWDGEWRDFSKRAAFEKFMGLPRRVPEACWTLAMNLHPEDAERRRIRDAGWEFVHPHAIARTPRSYYGFIASSSAEFSAVKLESFARSGWLSDRSAVYLAMGRPVLTESTGAEPYLPANSGILFAENEEQAVAGAREILADGSRHGRHARECAVACFDSVRNLRILLA